MPRLRKQTSETAIIERYGCLNISIEEAIVQTHLAGVSVRRVEDITKALWVSRVCSGAASNLYKKVYMRIAGWQRQKIDGSLDYVYWDGIVLKRSWCGEVKDVSALAAIGVYRDGHIVVCPRFLQAYLRDVLARLPTAKVSDLDALLPHNRGTPIKL